MNLSRGGSFPRKKSNYTQHQHHQEDKLTAVFHFRVRQPVITHNRCGFFTANCWPLAPPPYASVSPLLQTPLEPLTPSLPHAACSRAFSLNVTGRLLWRYVPLRYDTRTRFFSSRQYMLLTNDHGNRKCGEASGKSTERCMGAVDARPAPRCFIFLEALKHSKKHGHLAYRFDNP